MAAAQRVGQCVGFNYGQKVLGAEAWSGSRGVGWLNGEDGGVGGDCAAICAVRSEGNRSALFFW